ncbi:FCSD flavin-binding domain-containing protein [Bradyrhizobium jicamae]|uniref:NAD(P)/FAD-dependent oxidoreductase n=1 Tax=Bradyrhizobium jicamae TaxID=280332 RepID=UPI001BAB53F5|nr:NAD(P)/FAD-dependent oxidoreductase [Bradyrhizobium jicamae]MBR0758247.1 FCSD flavin-binding domain-containing protein [Bradyrhizobium jicamae]
MAVTRRPTRRDVVRSAAAVAAVTLACPSLAQASPRVAVIGGGFGGAACARALRRLDAGLQVTLIEPNKIFTACPFSNEVIAGLRELTEQQFTYDKVAADGVTVAAQAAVKVDNQARTIGLADGSTIAYDRLVLAPGIDMRFDALPGYDEAASQKMPHAWKAGEQTLLLRKQLEAMDDGGTVAIAVPAAPLRCPPAPYERAGLIAHYLKTKKPRSKILILDAKDNYSQQKLFENAWKELYPGMIERIALSQGGRVTSIDPGTNEIVTDFGNYTAQVANIIPPQKAGRIAEIAGAADHTGWCPIDPVTFASKLLPNIHVIGDACIAGGIPKSASAASAQGKACAAAIVNALAGKAPDTPRLNGACYNTVAPGYAFSLRGIYQPKDGQYAEAEVVTSPVDASREVRQREADEALGWFKAITGDAFG